MQGIPSALTKTSQLAASPAQEDGLIVGTRHLDDVLDLALVPSPGLAVAPPVGIVEVDHEEGSHPDEIANWCSTPVHALDGSAPISLGAHPLGKTTAPGHQSILRRR